MAPMKVYGWAVSPWMARVLVCLEEAGAEYELVSMSRNGGDHRRPEHLARNSFSEIPVLEDGDLMLYRACVVSLSWAISCVLPHEEFCSGFCTWYVIFRSPVRAGTRHRSELLMPPNAPATQQEECRRRDEQHLADCRQRPRKVAGTPLWPRNQPTTGKQRGGDSRT
ncbi:uncharacterized protein LOC119307123 isoform X2 [Triticum dicoccoides]|uniref:uncharacterized protein LOC119307123 isoform X2 n=1 Tax=Triticum dicoccoides TaxID=85692 RepID=UPI00188E6292|nr:uncharacterized protein LOC119307123 isoform X2 [Triticum dicoccoides]